MYRRDEVPTDWTAMAAECARKAETLQPGLERDKALREARQLKVAANIRGFLQSKELRQPD